MEKYFRKKAEKTPVNIVGRMKMRIRNFLETVKKIFFLESETCFGIFEKCPNSESWQLIGQFDFFTWLIELNLETSESSFCETEKNVQ